MTINLSLFKRKPLSQICSIPDDFISVYIVEKHIWADAGSLEARRNRKAEPATVQDFLIEPVRPLLNDIFRKVSAAAATTTATAIATAADGKTGTNTGVAATGQGYWIQADFGSGKSHLLSFIGALALGDEAVWKRVEAKEKESGVQESHSLHSFWERGFGKIDVKESKGIFVTVKTLVGQGSGAVGVDGSETRLVEYILDAIQEQYRIENGRPISLYPAEILAERFLRKDLDRCRGDLEKFLSDPNYFDENERETLDEFLEGLRDETHPGVRRDCGLKLWRFYEDYLETRPLIPSEAEDILKHAVEMLLEDGYKGFLLILDEVSLFMRNRSEGQRIEDEKTLVILSNRLVHNHNLPVWTVCAAQQKIETRMGEKNIIANERLKLFPLLNDDDSYYDIALSRVRRISNRFAISEYYDHYGKSFTWVEKSGVETFERFFPFHPESLDVVKGVSSGLTTVRSSLYFMHQALKTAMKSNSNELISLWNIFDDVSRYEEDPSGITQGISSLKTKWTREWRAYEAAGQQINSASRGLIKRFRSRCEKILKTLFLYHIAEIKKDGLNFEEIMNAVMEWKDHEEKQSADKIDNLDHYEMLIEKLDLELIQIKKTRGGYVFTPVHSGIDWNDLFFKARLDAEQSELALEQAWNFLLCLNGWKIETSSSSGVIDLARNARSIFWEAALSGQKRLKLEWRKREIMGMLHMRDLLDIASNRPVIPALDSCKTDDDFAVYVSTVPCEEVLDTLAANQRDPRVLFWSPAPPTISERELLIDFAAYIQIVNTFKNQGTRDAEAILERVRGKIEDQIGGIVKIVSDRYGRGRVAATDHHSLFVTMRGNLQQILEPPTSTVLDAVYASKTLTFKAAPPFSDEEALRVINGIVCSGEIDRNAKLDKNIVAVQNYAADLGIVKPGNEKKLDTSGSVHVRELYDWISRNITNATPAIPMEAIYKNFMGIQGLTGEQLEGGQSGHPSVVNHGLSRRLIDLYLLCLVCQGKLRIRADESVVPGGIIDYGTLMSITFKKQTLQAMLEVSLIKAPDEWPNLAPFAAILLDDPTIEEIDHDVDIQDIVEHLRNVLEEWRARVESLETAFANLFDALGSENPFPGLFTAWKDFVLSPVDENMPVSSILKNLTHVFGYQPHQSSSGKSAPARKKTGRREGTGGGFGIEDIADFKSRRNKIASAEVFIGKDREIRAADHYSALDLTGGMDSRLGKELKPSLARLQEVMGRLEPVILDQVRLNDDLLGPLKKLRDTYSAHYMKTFEKVTREMKKARSIVQSALDGDTIKTLEILNGVNALYKVDLDALRGQIDNSLAELFPEDLRAATVRAALEAAPYPRECGNLIVDAGAWMNKAAETADQSVRKIRFHLERQAWMLQNPRLRKLLRHGKDDPFIAGILEAKDISALAGFLVAELPGNPGRVDVLNRHLRKIRVKSVKIAQFKPDLETFGQEDIENVVEKFRQFLMEQFGDRKNGEDTIISIE